MHHQTTVGPCKQMQQLFREAVDAPSLKVLKVRLDGIQTELGGGNTAMAGGLELDDL